MNESLNNQFLELYEPLHSSFTRYCRAISGNNSDAEDLVQDTVVTVLTGFDKIKYLSSFKSFLFSVAGNLNYKRSRKKKYFIYQRKKYPLDFCIIANESFNNISKWEIDLTCCDYHNYYGSKDDNAIKTLVYFSLKSKSNEQLSKGTYMFTKEHLTTRKEMTFSGSIKIGSDEIDISDGEINVDYFEEEIIVKFNLKIDKKKSILGNYYGIYKTIQ